MDDLEVPLFQETSIWGVLNVRGMGLYVEWHSFWPRSKRYHRKREMGFVFLFYLPQEDVLVGGTLLSNQWSNKNKGWGLGPFRHLRSLSVAKWSLHGNTFSKPTGRLVLNIDGWGPMF